MTEAELVSVIAHELGCRQRPFPPPHGRFHAGQNVIRVVPGRERLAAFSARHRRLDRESCRRQLSPPRACRVRTSSEADAFASALMVKAGLGTGPQKSLFCKLRGLAGAVPPLRIDVASQNAGPHRRYRDAGKPLGLR